MADRETTTGGLGAIAVNYVKQTSRARREAAVWRSLLIQVFKILGARDLSEAIDNLNADQRELLLTGLIDHQLGDRELLLSALSLLDQQDRRSTHRGRRAA